MAMSDCVKCWDTPCRCGHDYQHWSVQDLTDQINMLTRVRAEKLKLPEDLTGVEPWDPDLSQETKDKIVEETRTNPEYLGTIVRKAQVYPKGE